MTREGITLTNNFSTISQDAGCKSLFVSIVVVHAHRNLPQNLRYWRGDAVIGLQRVMAHIIGKELLKNQKGLKAASHCLRSLLESMVDLKELIESSETDGSDTTSDTRSESASGGEDDDNDDSIDVRKYS